MKYKIDIWSHYRLVDSFQSDDVQEVLDWFRRKWLSYYSNEDCAFHLFEDGVELSFDEENLLGFFEGVVI